MRKALLAIVGVGVALTLLLIAYGSYLNHSSDQHIADKIANSKIPVQGFRVKKAEIYPTIISGSNNFSSDKSVDAMAIVGGRVAEVYVKSKDEVTEGQPLVRLVDEEIPIKIKAAEGNIAKAQVEVDRAKSSFDRYERLLRRNAASQEKYEEAKTLYESAEANYEAVVAQKEQLILQQERSIVRAPASGRIVMLYVEAGQFIQPGTPVALVGDFGKLNISLYVDNLGPGSFSTGDKVNLSMFDASFAKVYNHDYAPGNEGKNQVFSGVVTAIIPEMDVPAVKRRMYCQIDNSSGLLDPRSYVKVKIQNSKPYSCLVVPMDTDMSSITKDNMFVLQEDGTIKECPVKFGEYDSQYIEVVSGLKEDDIVIIGGDEGLQDGMKVDVELKEDV